MKFEFLLLSICIALFPITFSLLSDKYKINHIKKVVFALTGVIPFIIFDFFATNYFWYYNSRFIIDTYLLNLPLEKILFLLATSFTSLFLWQLFKSLRLPNISFISKIHIQIIKAIIGIATFYSFISNKHYTTTVLAILLLLISLKSITKTLATRNFTFYFLTITVLNILTNIFLTTRPIILYNLDLKSGINLISMPIEELFYSYVVTIICIQIYESTLKKH